MIIDNSQDIIDSRDVIARIAEIEQEASSRYDDQHPEGVSWGELATLDHAAYLDEEDADELRILREFAEEAQNEGVADWEHGATLIRDTYFEDYAEQLADEIGAIDSNAGWPLSFIDWAAAADALKADYAEADFDGVTYYGRT